MGRTGLVGERPGRFDRPGKQPHGPRPDVTRPKRGASPATPSRLPPPRGNGYWTQEIYYHILNCGLRIPPSAGSASGVLPNPVGYNRVYVHLDGPFAYEKWWEGLRAGRSFVTNGPLLRVHVERPACRAMSSPGRPAKASSSISRPPSRRATRFLPWKSSRTAASC